MKIAKTSSLASRDKVEESDKSVDTDLSKLYLFTQGRVRFGDGGDGDRGENISGEFQVVADTGDANAEFSVPHTIGAVPVGYLVIKINNAGVIYDSGTSWTSSTIYLKSSAANSAVSLFLLK